MTRLALRAIGAALLAQAFAGSVARADDLAAEADLHFRIGAERYQAGDYRGALEHFLASNRLVPNRNVVFNIGTTYERLRQFPDAYRAFAQVLEAETDLAARAPIEAALVRIAPGVAVLWVVSDPPGATIYVDRRDLGAHGSTPRALAFPPGRYRVIVERPGFEADERDVEAVLGTRTEVRFGLREVLGVVRIQGEPAGAAVRVDVDSAEPACRVPCDLARPPGRYLLYFTADGHQTISRTVEVRARQTVWVAARLQPLSGSIVVEADEPEALIEIGGRSAGFTPAVVPAPLGTRVVRVSKSGFRVAQRTVEVRAGEPARIRFELEPLHEVSVASRSTEEVQDAPASVSIVSGEELRAMGYPTVMEALRGVRGLYVSDDRSYATIGIRGLGRPGDYGNRVLVLSDGMPVNDNVLGSSYVGYDLLTDLGDVDRIEVVRGPGSVLYGTNAFSGVVNVVGRSRNLETGGDVGISAAEYGVARGRGGLRLRGSEQAGLWLSASGAHAEGRDLYFSEYDEPGAADGQARELDGFEAATVQGRAWWRDVSLHLHFHRRDKDIPTAQYETLFGVPGTFEQDTRALAELKFEPRLSSSWQVMGRAFVKSYWFRGSFLYENEFGSDLFDAYRERYESQTAGGEVRVVATPVTPLRLTVGAEAQEHLRASLFGRADPTVGPYLDADRPSRAGAGYVLADYTLTPRLRFSAGARLDAYSTSGSSLNPRAAVIARPWRGGNVKVLGGKAFRAPSIYELEYQDGCTSQVRPASLDPESIYSAEVEIEQRLSPRWTAMVAGFGTFADDLIVLGTADGSRIPACGGNPSPTQYENTDDEVLTLGGEAEVRREWRQGWMASASYSIQRTRSVDGPELSRSGDRQVPNSPAHLAALRVAAPVVPRAITAMTRLSLEGPRWDRNDAASDPAQRATDPAVLWDVALSGRAERLPVTWVLGLYNALDWRWAVPVSREFRQRTIPQNGRTLLLSVDVQF